MQDDNLLYMKTCRKCQKVKEITEFFMRKASKDRLDYDCKECKRENDRQWSKNNRVKKSASDKAYREANKEKMRKYYADYKRKQRQSDPMARLKNNLQRRMHKALAGIAKSASTIEMLGAQIVDIRKYLEMNFQSGMTWENYGKWHVDHRVPLASAKNGDELVSLFHYTNLQPLWALDNIRKSDKLEGNR